MIEQFCQFKHSNLGNLCQFIHSFSDVWGAVLYAQLYVANKLVQTTLLSKQIFPGYYIRYWIIDIGYKSLFDT